jgi:hypothetical protein
MRRGLHMPHVQQLMQQDYRQKPDNLVSSLWHMSLESMHQAPVPPPLLAAAGTSGSALLVVMKAGSAYLCGSKC